VEPVWGGTYPENMQKTVAAIQAAVRRTSPSTWRWTSSRCGHGCRDPLDDYVQRDAAARRCSATSPRPSCRICGRRARCGRCPSSAAPPSSTSTRSCSGRPAWIPASRHDLGGVAGGGQKATVRNPQGQVTTWGSPFRRHLAAHVLHLPERRPHQQPGLQEGLPE